MSEKVARFVATFAQMATFVFKFFENFENFLKKWPLFCNKSGQMATFKTKVGRQKCVNHAGFRAICPDGHFFFLFSCRKNFFKNKNIGKNLAIWPLTKKIVKKCENYKDAFGQE